MFRGIFYRFIAVLLVLFCSLNLSARADDNFKILSASIDSATNSLILSGSNSSQSVVIASGRIVNPIRGFVDIKDAVFIPTKQDFNFDNKAISGVKIAQFSLEPNIVRLVFISDSIENLEKVKVEKKDNQLVFKLGEPNKQVSIIPAINLALLRDKYKENSKVEKKQVLVAEKTSKPVDPNKKKLEKFLKDNKYVISDISAQNEGVNIAGLGDLSIKEPFMLSAPSRIVYDLSETTVANKELLKDLTLSNGDKVRAGRFDPNTIRLVINTDTPSLYKATLSADHQSLTITPPSKKSIDDLRISTLSSVVEKIDVNQSAPTTTITITTSKPMAHSVMKIAGKVVINLSNVLVPNENLVKNMLNVKPIAGFTVVDYNDGSRWTLPVKSGFSINTDFSDDAKTLKITIKDNTPPKITVAPPTKDTVASGKFKVVLDAGHGGYDVGANREGIYEKDITLDVAKRIKRYLARAGIDVVMTRESDSTVSLKERSDISNREQPNAFVSVHVNSCESTSGVGLETHWYQPQSTELAKIVHKSFTDEVNSPNRGIVQSRFYVINHTLAPSILVEIGFISNPQERYQLLTETRKDQTARSISRGIILYLNSKK